MRFVLSGIPHNEAGNYADMHKFDTAVCHLPACPVLRWLVINAQIKIQRIQCTGSGISFDIRDTEQSGEPTTLFALKLR